MAGDGMQSERINRAYATSQTVQLTTPPFMCRRTMKTATEDIRAAESGEGGMLLLWKKNMQIRRCLPAAASGACGV